MKTQFHPKEETDMAKFKVLKHSVVISGKSFEDCKAEYDRICNGIKKRFWCGI